MLSKKFKRIIAGTLTATMATVGLAGCSTSTTDGDAQTISIGYVNWAECVAVTNIWANLLEEQGYTVELTQLDVAPLFVGLSEGELDIFMDAWLPVTHATYWDEYQDSLYDAGIWYESSAKIGITVPSYVTIDSLAEFNDVADQFSDEIIGINPGAGIMSATESAIETYGLDSTTLVQGSEAAMMTSLEKAYEDGEWIAITGWSPHWMFASYDLKYLEDPEGSFGAEEELHTLLNSDFATANPDVVTMLESFTMDDNQIGSIEKLINDGMEADAAAEQWITENQDAVDAWLG